MATPPFGCLLITGGQTHQEMYARGFAADPRCRIRGLTDAPDISMRRRSLNLKLADELRVPHYERLGEPLSRPDVHFVSVCAEPERRGELTIQAAQAGKHVYLDKEPAASIEDANAVVNAVRNAEVRSQTFSLVRGTVAQRAKKVLESGELGELIALHCTMTFAKGIAGSADLSHPRKESASVPRLTFLDSKRELLCVGWYPLVLFHWLMGSRAIHVGGVTSNYFFASHQVNNVEDFAQLLLGYQNGVQATISVGRTGWSSHPSHGFQRLTMVGTRSVRTVDAFEPRLSTYSDAAPWRQPATAHPEDPMGFWPSTNREAGLAAKPDWLTVEPALRSDYSHFLDCLETDTESDVPASLAADVLATIFTAYRAAESGALEKIPLPSNPVVQNSA